MGKTAVITGASRGFGKHLASELLQRGWSVINISRTPCDLDGVKNYQVDFDVWPEQLKLPDDLKRCDLLILNAAHYKPQRYDFRKFAPYLRVNCLSQLALAHQIEHGKLAYISTIGVATSVDRYRMYQLTKLVTSALVEDMKGYVFILPSLNTGGGVRIVRLAGKDPEGITVDAGEAARTVVDALEKLPPDTYTFLNETVIHGYDLKVEHNALLPVGKVTEYLGAMRGFMTPAIWITPLVFYGDSRFVLKVPDTPLWDQIAYKHHYDDRPVMPVNVLTEILIVASIRVLKLTGRITRDSRYFIADLKHHEVKGFVEKGEMLLVTYQYREKGGFLIIDVDCKATRFTVTLKKYEGLAELYEGFYDVLDMCTKRM